jgi:hypothetical protein
MLVWYTLEWIWLKYLGFGKTEMTSSYQLVVNLLKPKS